MLFFLILPRRPPWTTLFPYTTLFRSVPEAGSVPGDFGGPAQHGRGSSLGRFAQAHGDGVATGSLHPSDLGDDAHRGKGPDEAGSGGGDRGVGSHRLTSSRAARGRAGGTPDSGSSRRCGPCGWTGRRTP